MEKVKILKKTTNKENKLVFDFTVEDVHHYILDTGVISHNSGLNYAADIVSVFSKAQYKEGETRVGSIISSTLEKGRDTKEKTKVKMLLHYNKGLHPYFGLADWAVQAGLITMDGKKYSINGKNYKEPELYAAGEEVFSKELLEKLNEYMKPFFLYGGGDEHSHVAPVVSADDEEKEDGEKE